MSIKKKSYTPFILGFLLLLVTGFSLFAKDSDFPKAPNPPRLVNDFAHMMTPTQDEHLEGVLENIARQTSTQITIITINNLGGYDVAQYVAELGTKWGIGQKGKDNGVIIFASKEDRKLNISPGYGLEGALPDITCAHIIRDQMSPAFKNGNYYQGFASAANAVIQATKGEYKAKKVKKFNFGGLIGLIVIIVVVVILARKGGGGGRGGNYMSRGGGSFLTGAILGGMLGGGMGRGFGGGFGGGGGGFGGFGGGGFGGGGASGGW